MRKPATLMILATVVLTGCTAISESPANPFNWFGSSQPDPEALNPADAEVNPLIPARRASVFFDNQPEAYTGLLIADVTELLVERRPGGAIIRATGQASRAGPFDVRLVPNAEDSTDSALMLDLRALQSPGPSNTGARARQVTVAMWVSDTELSGIRTISVRGANSARTVRR